MVTAYDPPRLAAMKGTSRSAPFEVSLSFQPVADGTRVDVEQSFDLRGPMRVIAPLFVRAYERGWTRGLENLKRLMESGEV